jgi:hypothetical protein
MTEALRRWLSFGLLLLLLICGTPFSRAEIANTTAAFGLSATFTCDEQATIAYDGRSLSAFDYDPVVVPTADRDATSTAAASRIIGKSAEFLAAEGTETFYRTMSQANYDTLMATGKLPATGETFISPSLQYAQQYNGVTVQFGVQAGTTDSLLGMGVRNAGLNGGAYGNLPLVQSGWGSSSAFFKLEGNVVNVGLGNGSALGTFNNNIVNFGLVPKP